MSKPPFVPLAQRVMDSSEAPRSRDIFYHCLKCGDFVPSLPTDNVGCSCGNVYVDIDMVRLAVADFSLFQVVKKVFGSASDGGGSSGGY